MTKIDDKHPSYDRWLPVWQKCRDAYAGQEAVHDKGNTYLPQLSGQDVTEYGKYKSRAMFFNATGRTVEGMVGMIMRKEPTVTAPASMDIVIKDFDLKSTHINDFADSLIQELATTNRAGLLVDYPRVSTVGMTIADIESQSIRPYVSIYKAESIIDWKFERVNNRYMLKMVKLLEHDDGELIRLLELNETGYQVSIYRKTDKGYNKEPDESFIPLMNNAPLRYIPFIFDAEIYKPIILDLVNVNFAHYKNSADYEHGLHFTGLPTPVFWGANLLDDKGNSTVSIGSTSAYGFSDPNGHAEYLEFTGQGLGALKTAMDDKVQMMVALGSRYLGAEKRQAETAEAMTIRNAGENSVIGKVAGYGTIMINRALKIIAEWMRVNPNEVSIKINKDVTPQGITPQMFQQLTASYLSGAISYEVYFANLQAGEIIEETRDIDDERLAIQEGGMSGGQSGTV